jgi:hypothetical protein
MVQFSDVRMSISRAQAEQIVKVVDNFVRTASYGRTWLDYTIHPRVLTLPKPMAYYGGPSQGAQRGDDKPGYSNIISRRLGWRSRRDRPFKLQTHHSHTCGEG